MGNSLSRPANSKSGGDHTRRAYHGIRNLMLHNELTPGQKFSYRDLKGARRTLPRNIRRVRQHVLRGLARISAEKDRAGL